MLTALALAAVYADQGARAERSHHTAELGAWLDSLDAVREMAMGRKVSPFADDPKDNPFAVDGLKPDPFDGPPRLFWWTTSEIKHEKWTATATTRRPRP